MNDTRFDELEAALAAAGWLGGNFHVHPDHRTPQYRGAFQHGDELPMRGFVFDLGDDKRITAHPAPNRPPRKPRPQRVVVADPKTGRKQWAHRERPSQELTPGRGFVVRLHGAKSREARADTAAKVISLMKSAAA